MINMHYTVITSILNFNKLSLQKLEKVSVGKSIGHFWYQCRQSFCIATSLNITVCMYK